MSKEEFVKTLKDKGFNAGFSNDGIPTVYVESEIDIHSANRAVKDAIKETGYRQSYGISTEKIADV